MKGRKILATVAGLLQVAIGALPVISVCALYYDLFDIQGVLGIRFNYEQIVSDPRTVRVLKHMSAVFIKFRVLISIPLL